MGKKVIFVQIVFIFAMLFVFRCLYTHPNKEHEHRKPEQYTPKRKFVWVETPPRNFCLNYPSDDGAETGKIILVFLGTCYKLKSNTKVKNPHLLEL
jgi:hypothetical protein